MRGMGLMMMLMFVLAGCGGDGAKTRAPAAPSEPIAISLTEAGFVPANVTVERNQPVTLVVTRKTDQGCAKDFVMKSQGIDQALPLDQAVTISFTPKESGTLRYACAMDMVAGTVTVK